MKQVLSAADFATIMNLVDRELSNYSMPDRYVCSEYGIDYEKACEWREKELQHNNHYQNLKHLKESLQNLNIEVECPDVKIKEDK